MKKQGFTLIELLAVIVIIGVIEKARKGAVESSTLGYIDAIEKYAVLGMVESRNPSLPNGVYDLPIVGLEVKGEKPSDGRIKINNKLLVTKASIKLKSYSKYITYENNKAKADSDNLLEKSTGSYDKYENGTVIYFNPETGQKCDNYIEDNSLSEVKSGCLKWYTFNASTVNMLLDHNTTTVVACNLTNANSEIKETKMCYLMTH